MSKQPDVVIVGAGVVGLCCAYSLHRRGAQVTVLDRGEPGQGASKGNMGWICPSFSGPVPSPTVRQTAAPLLLKSDSPLTIRPRADLGFLKWLWRFWGYCNADDYGRGLAAIARLNEPTLALFDRLAGDGVRFEMGESGVLFLFRAEAAAQAEFDELKKVEQFGFAAPVWLDHAELYIEEPAIAEAVVAGVLAPQERHVRPESLTSGLADYLRALGVNIKSGVNVTGFQRTNRQIQSVNTDQGVVSADHVVLAAGAWSGAIGRSVGLAVPVEAGRGYSVTLSPPPIELRRPTYFTEAHVACTPVAGAVRLGGTMELSSIDAPMRRERVLALTRAAQTYLRGWPRREQAAWVGSRPMTPDGLPLIGRAPPFDNLWLATGHAMLGVTLGPATGEAIANLVTNSISPATLTAFDPARFT